MPPAGLSSPSVLAVTLGRLFALLLFLFFGPPLSPPQSRALGRATEPTLRLPHDGHCQCSATALTVTSGGSCPGTPLPGRLSPAGVSLQWVVPMLAVPGRTRWALLSRRCGG